MTQVVTYRSLPGSSGAGMLEQALAVVRHVRDQQPDYRALREWLRERGIWDRETTADALRLVGLRLEGPSKPVVLTPPADRLLAAVDHAEAGRVLFDVLVTRNPILAKYVLEAVDTEADGRIHSTHELHRYLGSYAYPGRPIGLVDFQHWLRWMEAAEGIRLIGIRWGLGATGTAAMSRIRSTDVEELLEDEALEAEEPAEPSLELGAPAVGHGGAPDVSAVAAPVAPLPTHFSRRPSPGPQPAEAAQKASLALLHDHADDPGQAPAFTASSLGAVQDDYAVAPEPFVARMLLAGLVATDGDERLPLATFLGMLDELDAFARLVAGEMSLDALLAELGDALVEPGMARMAEKLVYLPRAVPQLSPDAEWLRGLVDAVTPEAVAGHVARGLLDDVAPLAGFWLLREMHRLELWDGEVFSTVAFVPGYEVRLAAFRLGLLTSPYATSFHELLGVAQTLAPMFPAEVGYDAPLAAMGRRWGCQSPCPNTGGCPFACREKQTW